MWDYQFETESNKDLPSEERDRGKAYLVQQQLRFESTFESRIRSYPTLPLEKKKRPLKSKVMLISG